jgi:flagellar biosynthesis protein FlhF
MGSLLNAGFSPQLAKRLAESGASTHDAATATSAVAERLEHSLMLSEVDEVVMRGGVYALVGPTGAGKTTTVAKIAARAVVRFGAANVALLTTDGYRIGAHEQLRIYGRILDVPVHAVRNQADLSSILAELRGRHLVLIDTIGMSQRDAMVAQHAAMLSGGGDVKRLLLVQTTSSTRTLEEVVAAYESTGVHGCILTKTDEAVGLAGALDVIVRHALPLHYVTDGQRVPEDLRLPDRAALVREAIEPAVTDALSASADDFALLTASLTTGAAAGVAIG